MNLSPAALAKRDRRFFEALSTRSRWLFSAAVFFTFGTIGFLQDLFGMKTLGAFPVVLAAVAMSGLFSVGIAFAITVSRWLIAPTIAAMVVASDWLLPALSRALGETPIGRVPQAVLLQRLQLDGMLCLLFIALGYCFWIWVIAGEGTRTLRLQTEVALAERIHSTLVPPVARTVGRFELYGRSEPSSEVGGDLLDVVERDAGLVVCVADVSGHGVAAGAFMGMVKSAIRMKLLASDALDALVGDLNDVVQQVKRPEMFVTLAALRFDGSNVAEVALAGHLPVLVLRAAGAVDTIDNQCPPLGVVDGQRYASMRVSFGPGDLFVLLTDGLTEVANRRGAMLELAGIQQVLERHAREPLADVYAAVLAAAAAHGPRADDQTLLLVRAR